MVEFFKTVDGRITEVSEFTEGCWVNMVHPSSDELEQIAQGVGAITERGAQLNGAILAILNQ